ncbi:hypothetical protein SAZ_32840 [Streptomyces noursei ZPM]|nr:hypothetical protein SAZ_32840 [Streptomyces noursei ZPM]EOS97465.1 hypothetical protein K530_43798 [Streptomyces noursei CCRC 11814]EXU92684.1 hypothetical protein P354_15405 [Streptomyces noursei PD-1]
MDVRRQGVTVRVVTFVRGVRGFDAGDLARLQTVASVDDAAVAVEHDGVQQAVFLNVVGEGLEVLLVERGEEQDGRVKLDE